MAINLTAMFKVRDQGTAQLRKITRELERNEKAMENLRKTQQKTTKASGSMFGDFKRLGGMVGTVAGGVGSLVSKLNPMALGFKAVGAAAVAAYAGVKVFNATVKEAMQMQQSQVMITAMFNDKQLADDYMKMLDKVAIESPLLDSQTMYSNSKSFVAVSKDVKQLEKMWALTERLVASDPAQGLEGAVFALRELFSGDAISMVERFEMPRDVMNDIKKMNISDQLVALDSFLNKMGFTEQLIADMGGTALGKWTQVKERMQLLLRDMGTPAIESVSKFLDGALSRLEGEPMRKLSEWGGKAINSILTGLTNSATRLYDWFTSLTSSPEFKSITTIQGKIDFVVTDIADKFKEWYDGGGQAKLQSFANTIVQFLTGVIDASPAFFNVASKIGGSIVAGIMDGIHQASGVSASGKFMDKLAKYNPASFIASKSMNLGRKIFGQDNATKESTGGGFYHGISDVPYDNMPARLHRGERVLTAQENKSFSQGLGGINIAKLADQIIVREDADIDKITTALVTKLKREAAQIG